MALVPLHAAAAAVGKSCGAVHQGAPAQPSMHEAVQHMDDAAGTHAHHESAGMAGDTADDNADSSLSVEPSHSTCSGCSAACIGAVAPPPAVLSVPASSGSETIAILLSARIAGFIPEGRKRPPRHVFA